MLIFCKFQFDEEYDCMRNEIRSCILSINKPFTYVTLSFYMRHYHGIKNMKLVPEVIEELCESGIIKKHNYNSQWYKQSAWEAKVYQRLRVREWKGRMPTYDPECFNYITQKSPTSVAQPQVVR